MSLGNVGVKEADVPAVGADGGVERHPDRLLLTGLGHDGEEVRVLGDRPLNIETARLAPREELLRVELRFGPFRLRVRARILADPVSRHLGWPERGLL